MIIGPSLASSGESQSELFRAANRATFVGSPTAGTDGTAQSVTVPGGAKFFFTTTRVLYPDGSKHHGVGIVPDVFVEPTQAGLRAHRDEVYETAVATLRGLVGKLP
jgi:C-terminal processing protease CtpA/Prc